METQNGSRALALLTSVTPQDGVRVFHRHTRWTEERLLIEVGKQKAACKATFRDKGFLSSYTCRPKMCGEHLALSFLVSGHISALLVF